MLQYAQIAPHAFAGHQPRHMREDIVGSELQKILAIVLKLATAAHFLINADSPARHTVVGDLRIDVHKYRPKEARLFERVVADGKNRIAIFRRLHQSVLVISALIPKDIFNVMSLGDGGAHDVVKHGVVAGMALDDPPHRRHFMRIEDRAEIRPFAFQHRRQRGGHAHVLVAEDHAWLGAAGGGAQRMQRRNRRFGQARVLLVIPDVLELGAVDAELFPQHELELPDLPGVVAADVDQQNLRRRYRPALLVHKPTAAVDDADVVGLLDLAEAGGQRRAVEVVEAGVQHFALRPEALLAALVAGPERADEDVARRLLQVHLAGQQTLEHRADAADLLDRFVGDVDDRLHEKRPFAMRPA